jgi:2-hydroxymuconate-semialdehyde hydrolase
MHEPSDARDRMLAATPLTQRRLQLAGVSTVVLEGGDGPAVVLLHGGIECGGAIWAPVTARLAEHHRLVVPDLPGLGESEPAGRLDADTFADWLTALLRATCQEPPTLIAHSLAGSMAARYAAGHRARLRRLLLYGAPAIGPYRMPLGLRVVAIRFGLRPTERNAERFDRWAFFDFDSARRHDPEWYEAFSAYTRSRAVVPHVKRSLGQLLKAGIKPTPEDDLRRIDVPTALLWGRHDRFVPLALAETASARYRWPLRVIDRAGHVPHIERSEAFLDALGEKHSREARECC